MSTYVVDTNIFLYDPDALLKLKNCEIIIPFIVLEELDRKKNGTDEVNRNARLFIKFLDKIREENNNLHLGVDFDSLFIKVELDDNGKLNKDVADNKIINVATNYVALGKDVVLLTRDINVRVKCDSLGIQTKGYEKVDEVPFSGYREVIVGDGDIDLFYSGEALFLDNMDIFPNEYLILKSESNPKHSGIARFIGEGKSIQKIVTSKDVWGLAPKNKEQLFAFDALLDPKIELVSLLGQAGCGKTIIAVGAGLQQTVEKKMFKKIVVMRPNIAISRAMEVGFLPGTLDEKIIEWMNPIFDQFSALQGNKSSSYFEQLIADGFIEFQSIGHVRGRSLADAFIIIDEAQNLSIHEIKTLITRVGKNSKIILTGDTQQIDAQNINTWNSGLSHVVSKFKKYDVSAHVLLLKGERSGLASLAAEIL